MSTPGAPGLGPHEPPPNDDPGLGVCERCKPPTLAARLQELAVALIVGVAITIANGAVLFYFWRWFIAPPFHFAPLAFGPSIGVAFAVRQILSRAATPSKLAADRATPKAVQTQALVVAIARPFVILTLGALFHLALGGPW